MASAILSEDEQRIDAQINRVAARLMTCRRLLFITGAGLSADSGLPTYRGVGGLYNRGATEDGMAIEEALSGAMMDRDPALCWKYIMQIESACRGAAPNRGHELIAEFETRFEAVWVLTQNVDGLHRRAGSSNIIDIHGDVRDLLCQRCDGRRTVTDYRGMACPPICASCGGVERPDVVLFGEMLPLDKLGVLTEQLHCGFDAVFSVGTTSVFPYIAAPVFRAAQRGSLTVEINPSRTEVSAVVDEQLPLGASEALGRIAEQLG